MHPALASLCLLLIVVYYCSIRDTGESGLVVHTSSGEVHGFRSKSSPNVRQFLGVPFAQPPLDDLRWLPPRALRFSDQKIQATAFGPACPQHFSSLHTLYNDLVPEFNIDSGIPPSEDCLTLSVWAPSVTTSTKHHNSENGPSPGLPVVVWIYGGGFRQGGSNTKYQDPAQWVERSQSHIVISIQYRVNIFGFPQARGLQSNNIGLLDQRFATEWVRQNCEAFGGDPNRIILWGQSAGGMSIDFLNFAFPDDPIARGFIADSGTAFLRRAPPDTTFSNFSFVATHLGCDFGTDAERELACMRKVPQQKIIAFVGEYADSKKTPALTFSPRPDEVVVFSNYTERYEQGRLAIIPGIFGSNANEGVSFVPFPTNPDALPDQVAADEATRDNFHCLAAKSSALREAAGRKTYRYHYRGNFTNISPRHWMGAYHSAELPLIMGTSGDFRGANTDFEKHTSREMQDLWLAFIEDPERAQGWEEYSGGQALVFGDQGKAVKTAPLSVLDAQCEGGRFA